MSQYEATIAKGQDLRGLAPSSATLDSSSDWKRARIQKPRFMPSTSSCSSTDTFVSIASCWSSKDDESTFSWSSSPDFILGSDPSANNAIRKNLPPIGHCSDITATTQNTTSSGRTSCIWTPEIAKNDEQSCILAPSRVKVDLPVKLPAWEDARFREEDTSNHDRFAQKELKLFEMEEPPTPIEEEHLDYTSTDEAPNSVSDTSDCDCASTEDGFWKWNESRQRFIHTDESTGQEIVCPELFD